ncbi:MAG: hypothetical protein ACRDTZ_22850 [Pseudonocardiaceae bacterium]
MTSAEGGQEMETILDTIERERQELMAYFAAEHARLDAEEAETARMEAAFRARMAAQEAELRESRLRTARSAAARERSGDPAGWDWRAVFDEYGLDPDE